jgi:flagella basal body P-ring formation protein FlgA
MKRIALLLVLLTPLAIAEESTVTLHQEVYVKGPSVTLGDIADLKGDAATELGDIELMPAASPGQSRRVDAALVRTRLRSAGVDPSKVAFSGAHSTMTKTLYLELTKEMLAEDLRSYIMSNMPWDINDATVDVLSAGSNTVIPDGDLVISWRPNPQYQWHGPATFRGEIYVDGELEKTLMAKAQVEAYVEVVVADRDLARGRLLSAADFRLEKRALSQMRRAPLLDVNNAAGLLARNPIYVGEVITERHLQQRVLIKRNEFATVKTRVGDLVVTGRARALADGHEGDVIMLVNPASEKEFSGVVQPDGTVVVD